jgi:glycine dehydrogenase subunit 2
VPGGGFDLVTPPQTIGAVSGFGGNFGILVRAYAYLRTLGGPGLAEASRNAVLNANYIMAGLRGDYRLAFDRTCMHEVVFAGLDERNGVKTLDVAKRLLDFGIHPPTVYFPLIVEEALMIEPTETESKETIDRFIEVMRQIAQEARDDPDLVKNAPYTTPVGRLDEATAARKPVLRHRHDL